MTFEKSGWAEVNGEDGQRMYNSILDCVDTFSSFLYPARSRCILGLYDDTVEILFSLLGHTQTPFRTLFLVGV